MKLVRSVAVVGVTWGVVWAALALLVGTAILFIDPSQIDPGEQPIALAPIIGLVGFACGLVFAAVVALAERRLDPPRIHLALWGLAIGAALPLVLGQGLPEMLVTAPIGALSALLSVKPLSPFAL